MRTDVGTSVEEMRIISVGMWRDMPLALFEAQADLYFLRFGELAFGKDSPNDAPACRDAASVLATMDAWRASSLALSDALAAIVGKDAEIERLRREVEELRTAKETT